MVERLLPPQTTVVSTREEIEVELFPAERAALGRSVEKRRREFVTARACARRALKALGIPVQPIPVGERGEPRWPSGVIGSITHCDGYRACALAHSGALAALGIDAEPNRPLPDGVLADVASREEREAIRRAAQADPSVSWDRLLFSAKESVYKAWFPLARRWLGFEDARVEIDRDARTFTARLLVPGPVVFGAPLGGFRGRWLVEDGLVVTAIAAPAERPEELSSSLGQSPCLREDSATYW
jgi:4'-phosphopantetheinyl transferase EntD